MKDELLYAIVEFDKDKLDDMLSSGRDINMVDKRWGTTPLYTAAAYGNADSIEYLLKKNANPEIKKEESQCSTTDTLSVILRNLKMRKTYTFGSYPLSVAAENGHADCVTLILAHRKCPIGEDLVDALEMAAMRGNHKVLKQLINDVSNIPILYLDRVLNTVAMSRSLVNNVSCIQELLECGARPNLSLSPKAKSLMCTAASRGDVDVVHLLIQYGESVNHQDLWHHLPLHSAAGMHTNVHFHKNICLSKARTVKVLLENGAYVDAKDNIGDTALLKAAQGIQLYAMQELIHFGCELNYTNNNQTALHWVAQHRNALMVQTLLDAGANCNVKNQHQVRVLCKILETTTCSDVDQWWNTTMVRNIILAGYDLHGLSIAVPDDNAILVGLLKGHLNVVKLLLVAGIDTWPLAQTNPIVYGVHDSIPDGFVVNLMKNADGPRSLQILTMRKVRQLFTAEMDKIKMLPLPKQLMKPLMLDINLDKEVYHTTLYKCCRLSLHQI